MRANKHRRINRYALLNFVPQCSECKTTCVFDDNTKTWRCPSQCVKNRDGKTRQLWKKHEQW